jgi:hypothetical protein
MSIRRPSYTVRKMVNIKPVEANMKFRPSKKNTCLLKSLYNKILKSKAQKRIGNDGGNSNGGAINDDISVLVKSPAISSDEDEITEEIVPDELQKVKVQVRVQVGSVIEELNYEMLRTEQSFLTIWGS